MSGNGRDLVPAETRIPSIVPEALDSYNAPEGGKFVRFDRGNFLIRGGDALPNKAKLVAALGWLQKGWVKWVDKKPVKHMWFALARGSKELARASLGDTDASQWPDNPVNGEPEDPWKFTYELMFSDPSGGDAYTFTTNTTTGRIAVDNLVRAYKKDASKHAGKLPLVQLEGGTLPNKFSTRVPVFTIVDWVEPADVSTPPAQELLSHKEEMDDEIPW